MEHNTDSTGTHLHRMARLEDQARYALDALELAASLGDFQVSISSLHEPTLLLQEVVSRIGKIAEFDSSAVYLVDEATSDFFLGYSDNTDWEASVEAAVDSFIDSGMFSFALREGRPVVVHSVELQCKVLMHVLETASRVRGMFVGIFPSKAKNLTAVEMALLSIVCKSSASAIEAFELYKCFKSGGEGVVSFADSLPAGVVDIGAEGRLLFVNKAAGTLLGCMASPEKRFFVDFLIPEERERIASLLISCSAFGDVDEELVSEGLAKPANVMRTTTFVGTQESHKAVHIHLVPMWRNGTMTFRGVLEPADELLGIDECCEETANTRMEAAG